MKIDNGKHQFEKRRKRTFTPIIYMFSEVTLAWILLSVVNISFDIQMWEVWSHLVLVLVFMYSGYKTHLVFERQKKYKLA